ncbi:MAG: hypothetical protein COY66_03430 [Candidatus Kerfeldbacteria bacterium CG_4_10_14_0_8_um_filter_42_10]|uniref:Dipeptidylpeptidase IV N-terminal domain-containing protein n=1 Tax=Candidatus Kerfeldbacteria bacterium CG_4_10_14_0_8_um_filter_42_10 TaxID=2014248 RepID=A0A2M7RIV3_9BACT|nr:MAG: hypothetical protein COY66_03430 [Candidatus Kerfeldbacteria bacterium CG_4_10_14_0_8_um_filter_42_10]
MKYFVLALAVVILAAGGIYLSFQKAPEGQVISASANYDSLPSTTDGLISFVSNRDGNDEIYLTDSKGSFSRRITNTSENETEPILSFSKSQIAFFSQGSDYTAIYLFALTTGEKKLLTITRGIVYSMKFSPNGQRILFLEDFSKTEKTRDLYLINTQTSAIERVASGVQDYNWSSDSNGVVYTVNDSLKSITDTKLLFRAIDEKERLLDEVALFQGGVAPVYFHSNKKVAFLDVTGEFLRLISTTSRGENQQELFTIRIRPQESSFYFLDTNSDNSELLLTIYTEQILVEPLIISLKEQTVKRLELEANKLEWESGDTIVYSAEDQNGHSQIWVKENTNSEGHQLTSEMSNWF